MWCGSEAVTMRPGKRQNLRSAIAVAAVSLLGVLMSGPLAWEAPDTLSFRARYTLVGPGALLVVASAVHVDAVRRDGFCCLWAAITLGFLCWPLCLVPFAGMSVAGLWKLACRHPDLAQRGGDAIALARTPFLTQRCARCFTQLLFRAPGSLLDVRTTHCPNHLCAVMPALPN